MNDALENVILVDENDKELGLMGKLKAHELGLLHRAFSVFIFNSDKKMLLQKRASTKYHSPNLWTNACCSHPRNGETILEAANRRLQEEMGMSVQMKEVGHLIYKAKLDQGLIENEYDHILIGFSDQIPTLNLDEVSEYKYLSFQDIEREVLNNPSFFTEWFKLILPTVKKYL